MLKKEELTMALRYFVWVENKEQENFDETPKFVFDTFYADIAFSGSKSCSSSD